MAPKRILNKKEQGAENYRKGKKFEEEVEELLRLKGYTIEEHNIKVDGYEIDIIA
jgi:Holliday junction resolvase-like predicted endonuclease